jgi:agmatinase
MDEKFYLPNNFGCLPKEFCNYNKSKTIILPVPYDGTLSYKSGARDGPNAIIRASMNMELYDEELKKNFFEEGIHTLPEVESDFSSPENMIGRVYSIAKELVSDNKKIVLLGGEHSLSFGVAKALKEKFHDLSVLQIDAHSDLRDSWEQTKFSHACVMKRITEICPAVQVGIRSISEEELLEIEKQQNRIFWAKDMAGNDSWMDKAIDLLSENIYITLDLDALDPSIMPATGTPEPGGLGWYETLKFLKKVCGKKNIAGFDVMELSPIPGSIASDFLAAKLVYKMIGYSSKR